MKESDTIEDYLCQISVLEERVGDLEGELINSLSGFRVAVSGDEITFGAATLRVTAIEGLLEHEQIIQSLDNDLRAEGIEPEGLVEHILKSAEEATCETREGLDSIGCLLVHQIQLFVEHLHPTMEQGDLLELEFFRNEADERSLALESKEESGYQKCDHDFAGDVYRAIGALMGYRKHGR